MAELLDLAAAIVERGASGEQTEAFMTYSREFTVKTFGGEIESLSSSEPRGAGVRVVADGRVGFAYTTDLTDEGLDALVAEARDNARYASPDEAAGLGGSWDGEPEEVTQLSDPEHGTVTAEEKIAFALELEAATKAADARVRTVEDTVYSDAASEIAIATSTGIAGSYARTEAWCYAIAIAAEGEDTEVGFDFGLARSLRGLDAAEVGEASARRATGVLGAGKIPSARMPVVFDPYTAGQFLGVIAGVLTGESVQKGRSLFAGRLGEEVAAGSLTLWDDGRVPGAPGSAPWDAEGTPTGRTEIISAGKLSSYLYDVTSARREGRASTGNASRAGFRSVPSAAPTNLAFDDTGLSRQELLSQAGRAFLVQDFHGVHSGANPISGDFSVGATGVLLDGGEVKNAVKEVTIAAGMLDILKGIVAVADDRRWLPFGGSLGGSTTLVAEMTVAGS